MIVRQPSNSQASGNAQKLKMKSKYHLTDQCSMKMQIAYMFGSVLFSTCSFSNLATDKHAFYKYKKT